MSTSINPSSIMIYKIVKDFEQGKAVNIYDELRNFANSVVKYASSKSHEGFWILESNENNAEIKNDLSKLCDLTPSICEVNEFKYKNGGDYFAKLKIGTMPYILLKCAVKTYKELQCEINQDDEKLL